ncbi:MAG: hypothetical protein E6772_08345 [Dysgonomonas sp.]|nr:hypothetical protein [Dysgonomonas sp.]
MKPYIAGVVFLISIVFVSCQEYTPKPIGYNRIDIKEDSMKRYEFSDFSFENPESARIDIINTKIEKEFWFDIVYPQYNATIHCTYLPITKQTLPKALEDSYHLAYSHTTKADGINQHLYNDLERKIFGILYEIEGNVATPAQFFVTDSIHHFLRGSFYYTDKINTDSVAPVTEYIVDNIRRIMNTVEWKK